MAKFHTDSRYLEHLHKISQGGDNDDPQSGHFGLCYECPVVEGISDYASAVGGATLTVAIDWSGGWHHAKNYISLDDSGLGKGKPLDDSGPGKGKPLDDTGLGKGKPLDDTGVMKEVQSLFNPETVTPLCSFNMTPVRRAQCLRHVLDLHLPTLPLGGGTSDTHTHTHTHTTILLFILPYSLPHLSFSSSEIPDHEEGEQYHSVPFRPDREGLCASFSLLLALPLSLSLSFFVFLEEPCVFYSGGEGQFIFGEFPYN
uniref:Histone deacetylase n=1 Tax=Oncorhynchus tshawytscha TaxID=74940 RepID=A0AAZ3NZK0_ONCTS